jgi:menaquinone-dependent protoporphyrinogen IX oxidase
MAKAKCLVVYGSKYGSTREVAQAVADGLEADIADASTLPDVREYDLVVIGSPIYGNDYLAAVIEFIQKFRTDLDEKRVAAFITAAADWDVQAGLTGDEDDLLPTQQEYAEGLATLCGGHMVACRGFGGRLVPDQLDETDRGMLEWFYQFLMRKPLEGFDLLDPAAAYRWGEDLRDIVSA